MNKFILMLLVLVVCSCTTHNPPKTEFYEDLGCWAHELYPLEKMTSKKFQGLVSADGDNHYGIRDVLVALRNKKDGKVFKTTTNESGDFFLPSIPDGSYDGVACKEGFNPWRGIIIISPSGKLDSLELKMTIGM